MDNVKGLGIMSSLDYGEIYSDLSVASNGTATITSVKKLREDIKLKGILKLNIEITQHLHI